MGSFNTSCMVSQQVITPGAEVVIFPIRQESTYNPVELSSGDKKFSIYGVSNSTCYPTAFWGYAGPMIHGKYDDYGRFELSDTEETKESLITFFDLLHKESLVTSQGENKSHDLAFDMKNIYTPKVSYSFEQLIEIWDTMFEVSSKCRLFIKSHYGEPKNLQFAVVHKAAADYLKNITNEKVGWDDSSYEKSIFFKKYMQSQVDRTVNTFPAWDEKRVLEWVISKVSFLEGYRIGETEGAHFSFYHDAFDKVIDLMEENDNVAVGFQVTDEFTNKMLDILSLHIDHRYIHSGMESLGIKLSPMVYASQDYDNETGKAYASMVQAVSREVLREIKVNRDDFDEEDMEDDLDDAAELVSPAVKSGMKM